MIKTPPSDESSATSIRLLVLPVWILAVYTIGLLFNEAATICLWVVCAFFLFALLDPIAEYFKSRRWPTNLVASLLILIATVLTFAAIYFLGTLFSGMVKELEQSKQLFMHSFDSLNSILNSWHAKLPGFHSLADKANDKVSKVEVVQSSPIGSEMGGTILHGVGSAASILAFALLVPILTFFLLAERDALANVIKKAYTNTADAVSTWEKIVESTRAFFLGNLVLGLITLPLFALLFWLFSVPSLLTVAALATVFNLIPFAGAVLSGFLPAVALYAETQNAGSALGLYGCCVLIHFIIADFVTPKILGAKVNINATTSTIALVAWGEIWGGVGLILAIPLTSLIKIMFEHSHFFWLQWMAGLMSEGNEGKKAGRKLVGFPKKTE